MVAVLVIGMMVGLGLVGFLDDFLKTRKQRSLGLGGWSKIAGQVIVGTVFAVFAILPEFPDENGLTPASTLHLVRPRHPVARPVRVGPGHRRRSCSCSG